MAKKYLLYIHDDEQFDKVEEKSGLVNHLLNHYWAKDRHKKLEGKKFVEVVDEAFGGEKTKPEEVERILESRHDFCKNGHIAKNGKCTWKGCKYS